MGTAKTKNLLVLRGAELREGVADFGVFPGVEVGGCFRFCEGFGEAALKAEQLSERPMRLEPMGVRVDCVAEGRLGFGGVVLGGGDGRKVVPGVEGVVGCLGGAFGGRGGELES